MMSDVEEPPSKIVKVALGPASLEPMEGEEGQEEWLSEGLLTDDDYNPSADQTKSESILNTSQESQQSVDQRTDLEIPTENIEQKLNSFENSQNGIELPDDIDSFLVKKEDKENESEIDESVKQSDEDDDGHNTDDLLRMLGEGESKKAEGQKTNDNQTVLPEDNSTDDDDDYIFEGAKVTQLKVAKNVLMRKYPAAKAVPEDMSDSDIEETSNETRSFNRSFARSFQSLDEASVVKKMFGVKKSPNVASKSTAKSSVVHMKSNVSRHVPVSKPAQKPTLSSSTPLRQYVNKNLQNNMLSKSDSKQQQGKSISKQPEETDEIINEEEFLEDDEFDLDEEFADESDTDLESRRQPQRIMKPEEMDEEIPSDGDSHSEDGSLYDELPSTDSEEMEDWFTFDIRAERAGEYLPLLGSNAMQLLTEEKHRVKERLDQLRQSLTALTESGREQAEQLRKAKTSLVEIDAMLAAS